MYCRFCGKEIRDESSICLCCVKNLIVDDAHNPKMMPKSIHANRHLFRFARIVFIVESILYLILFITIQTLARGPEKARTGFVFFALLIMIALILWAAHRRKTKRLCAAVMLIPAVLRLLTASLLIL